MISEYFRNLVRLFENSPLVVTHDAKLTWVSPTKAYVEGRSLFVDGSQLHFFEFLTTPAAPYERESQGEVRRIKYRYHYQEKDGSMIFRYDDAPHHPDVKTFPHHKHTPMEIIGSPVPSLEAVFEEISREVIRKIQEGK